MKHFYLDQSITNKICEDIIFSTTFYQKHIIGQRQLATTPFCLIEFCGCLVKECLKSDISEYNIDFSNNLLAEACKAREYYQNNIKLNILQYLESCLVKNRKSRIKTSNGIQIYKHYNSYLNYSQIKETINFYIYNDRACALFWERFGKENTYSDIFDFVSLLLALNPHFPCLRLIFKSIRKLPVSNDSAIEETREKLIHMLKRADIKKDKDLVDIEFIQLSIMGYHNNPLQIYTMDNAKEIKIRLHIAYLLLKVIVQNAKNISYELDIKDKNVDEINVNEIQKLKNLNVNDEEKKYRLKVLQRLAHHEFRFGVISIIDNLGCVKENIKVKQCLSKTLELQ